MVVQNFSNTPNPGPPNHGKSGGNGAFLGASKTLQLEKLFTAPSPKANFIAACEILRGGGSEGVSAEVQLSRRVDALRSLTTSQISSALIDGQVIKKSDVLVHVLQSGSGETERAIAAQGLASETEYPVVNSLIKGIFDSSGLVADHSYASLKHILDRNGFSRVDVDKMVDDIRGKLEEAAAHPFKFQDFHRKLAIKILGQINCEKADLYLTDIVRGQKFFELGWMAERVLALRCLALDAKHLGFISDVKSSDPEGVLGKEAALILKNMKEMFVVPVPSSDLPKIPA